MDVLDDLQAALEGRYEVVRELGRGGMAVVYLARDLKHGRQVAIKVLPPEMGSGVGAERFLREIQTAAQLSHPNILPLHDSIAVDHVRCYVMPYVQGESLRQRLDRERQLGIDQAVDIARQVAAGLDYAHAHGVIHRDIKPENILLVGDQAVIADFGLALALFSASSTPFTATGMAVGTPAYMSPEQGAADRAVDGRTDVYALGCVFFEMVAGMPPFRGATPGALLAAHATRTPPSLCAERESCPAGMDAAVQRALAKVPADRFRTAGEFVHALDGARHTLVSAPAVMRRVAWVPWAVGVTVVAAFAALAAVMPAVTERFALSRVPLDSSTIAMLPVDGTGGRHLTTAVARQRLTSALMQWRDLRVVEPPAGASVGNGTADAGRIARRAGAARVVAASAAAMGDSVELRATLYDAKGEVVRQQTARVADDPGGSAQPYRALVANLLRTSDGEDEADDANPGTTRVAAWRAFTHGDSLRRAWSLAAAETEFRRATALDPSFARAHLWLAQVMAWERPGQPEDWADEAGRAITTVSGKLGVRDSLLATGLSQLGAGRYPDGCATYRDAHDMMPRSDLPWYGLGYCRGLDPVVVHSPASPSGWAFRGDVNLAAAAFDSALTHAEGAPSFAYEMLGLLLIAEPLRTRAGHAAYPDGTSFYAYPALVRDSLLWIPYPAVAVERGAQPYLATRDAALQRNLRRLDALYRAWIARAPRNPFAWTALGRVQELQGQAGALETVTRARALSDTTHDQLALAVTVIRLLVKQGQFDEAYRSADSLLRAVPNPDSYEAESLAGVAALIGDVAGSARLLTHAALEHADAIFRSPYPPPAGVAATASEFLATAADGKCTKGLQDFAPRLEHLLLQYASLDQRAALRRAMLVRPLSLAVPCLGARAVAGLPDVDRLVRMQQALAVGDISAVRAGFDTLRQARRGMRPGDVALDHTFQEAWLLAAMGDTIGAVRYLDLPLTSLPTLNIRLLEDVPAAAALGRALLLRAQLAEATGDSGTAARFSARRAALQGGMSHVSHGTEKRR